MRYLFIFLISFSTYSQVNFSTYGAVGNGVADDTAALQAALDAESNLIANANAVFKVSSRLDIDIRSGQTINWNNATIVYTSQLNPAMRIDKRNSNGGTTTMSNLTVDGNDIVIRGIEIRTRVVFNNVDVKDLYQGTNQSISPAGFLHRVSNNANSMGAYEFNNCTISNLVGNSDCVVASNTDGSVNGYLLYWDNAPTTQTIITHNNTVVDGMWGDDGGGVFVNDFVTMKNTSSKIVFNGGAIRNCERRALKGFASNMEFNNTTFQSPEANNPNIHCGTISGMVVFGGANNKENVHFNECTFIGTTYESRVIPVSVKNWSIRNSTFQGGAHINMTDQNGPQVQNGLIECNEFGTQGFIGEYTSNTNWTNGTIGIGGNLWTGGDVDIRILSSEYHVTTPVCSDLEPEPEPDPEDEDAPTVTGVTLEALGETFFRSSWSLNEGSKGRVLFDTSSRSHADIPTLIGLYSNNTALENNFLTFHRQTAGGTNPFPLTPNTTYYYRYYTEDASGNTSVSAEYNVTTLSTTTPDPTIRNILKRNTRISISSGSRKLIINN